jgi:CBS domain-containing protein
VGIVTDRDIVMEALANGLDLAETKVAQIMSRKLVIAAASEDTSDAIDRMRMHGVRRLPVVDHDGRLMGIVTLDDLLTLHAAQGNALADIVSKEQGREHRTKR